MDSIQLSKIVANPTSTRWAQVYSTLNLYVVLSISSTTAEGEEGKESSSDSVAAQGKELLERIQREYFSQDEKSLENIKKSIEAATAEIGDLSNISIVLANVTGEVLYLILVSEAKVILRRKGKVAVVAAGTKGIIEAYSGKIEPRDVVLLETEGFSKKVSVDKLSETLDHLTVTEIAENLAPLVHTEADGNEAAIILEYKKEESEIRGEESAAATALGDEEKEEPEEGTKDIPDPLKEEAEEHGVNLDNLKNTSEADDPISHLADGEEEIPSKKLKFALPEIFASGKRKFVIIALVVLAILFVGGIYFEKNRKESAAQNQMLTEILEPGQKRFDEAVALINLNKGLALDEFNDLKMELEASRGKLPEGSDARKKLDEFIGRVESKIGELGQGAALANQKVIFENADQVTFRDGQLSVISKDGKINLLDNDGKSTKEIDSKNTSPEALTGNETDIYTAGAEGVTQSAKSGSSKTVIEDADSIASLDTFGTNLYALNTADKTVDKYPTGTFTKASYFTEDVTLNDPSSMSIDSSIWILDSGKVRKFTKGKEDDFSVNGLTKDIGSNSQITTGIDYTEVYVLDPSNRRVVSISKSGEVKNQYVAKILENATSIAVDEEGKKIYVVISGKLNSFDL